MRGCAYYMEWNKEYNGIIDNIDELSIKMR